jgi:mannose-6-phosphate isomerase-like protein (cupin superfamily)
MMNIIDLRQCEAEEYLKREKNILFHNDRFKARIIVLEPGKSIPRCTMESYVIFVVIAGDVTIHKNDESEHLKVNQMLVSEPAVFSMETETGARLLGLQIKA